MPSGRAGLIILGASLLAVLAACVNSSQRGVTPRKGPSDSLPADGCLTRGCHGNVPAQPNVHTPVAEQPCVFCHRARGKDHPGGEGMEFESIMGRDPAFCMGCHPETGPRPAFTHKPYKRRHCRECHEIHGSPIRPLMKRDVSGACLYCHRDVAARLENCRFVHGAVNDESCVDTCHDPHESDNPRLLRTPVDDLCLECHDAPGDSSHPPSSRGDCVGCHYPHAGNLPGLVKER